MKLIGFCYATGTLWCDKDKEAYPDGYEPVAYVWENGTIDWKIDSSKYDVVELIQIYRCSASYANKVNEKRRTLRELKLKWLTLSEDSLEWLNTGRYIARLKRELSDLERYKTTAVIHHLEEELYV